MPEKRLRLSQEVEAALAKAGLSTSLRQFAASYVENRGKVIDGERISEAREQLRLAKAGDRREIEEMAEQFETVAAARGAKVFRAGNAQEACQMIYEIFHEHGAKLGVKAKSMTSEEIFLNDYLQERGITIWESDLGEWIVQLAKERPSHMVMPAIHMTRQEVAKVFAQRLGTSEALDIDQLVKVARIRLRQVFLTADIGITGANAAVAETGTLAIVTNEGNARLTTTIPPVHIALVGYDKLIRRLTDLGNLLGVLPACATAQTATSYVTMITGPSPGPVPGGELYIILLDNGRLDLASDGQFSQLLRCIKCASCLNVCPIYQQVGGHVFGHVYSGGIGSLLTAFVHGLTSAAHIQSLCSGCGRCAEFCPAGIDIPGLTLELRRRVVEEEGLPLLQGFTLARVVSDRRRFHGLLRAASRLQSPLVSGRKGSDKKNPEIGPDLGSSRQYIRHLPLFLSKYTKGRSLPAIAAKPFRDRFSGASGLPGRSGPSQGYHRNHRNSSEASKPVAFYSGCLVDFVYPEIGEALAKVLGDVGIGMVHPEDQTCCGAPAQYLGDYESARRLLKENITAFESVGDGSGPILTACPTCARFLSQGPARLLFDDHRWHQRGLQLAGRVMNACTYLADTVRASCTPTFTGPSVAYHDACHLKTGDRLAGDPPPSHSRRLLQAYGYRVKEMNRPDQCCGFAGSYSLKFPALSRRLLEEKIDSIRGAGVDLLAVDCPGCLLQIGGGLDKTDSPVRVFHTLQLLAASRGL